MESVLGKCRGSCVGLGAERRRNRERNEGTEQSVPASAASRGATGQTRRRSERASSPPEPIDGERIGEDPDAARSLAQVVPRRELHCLDAPGYWRGAEQQLHIRGPAVAGDEASVGAAGCFKSVSQNGNAEESERAERVGDTR